MKPNRIIRDFWRTFSCILFAYLFLFISTPIAKYTDEPMIAVFGMGAACVFLVSMISHWILRVLFPYLDGHYLFQVATGRSQTGVPGAAIGAGLVFLGRCIVTGCLLLFFGALFMTSAKAETVHQNAIKGIPILKMAINNYWKDMPCKSCLAAQIEVETGCPGKWCWNPKVETPKSVRWNEWGAGWGQITKTKRFDALTELKEKHKKELSGWGWGVTLHDPHYQAAGIVLKNKDNYRLISNTRTEYDRLAMMFSAYNGGFGGLIIDRKKCQAIEWCDQSRWIGHVAITSTKSTIAKRGYGYGAFWINRKYVSEIMDYKSEKYNYLFK